jgi:hypothetical protein
MNVQKPRASSRYFFLCCGAVVVLAMRGPQPPDEYSYDLPLVPMDHLRPAQTCQTTLPMFGHLYGEYWAPHGAIELSNDGGWCWLQFGQMFRRNAIVPDVQVIQLPSHGEVVARRMPDRVSIAYRPAPGFAGTDQFKVRTKGPIPHTIPFDVTVR